VCGICGAVAKDGKSDTAASVLLMLKEMSHRGPDSAGIAWDGGSLTAPTLARLLAGARAIGVPRTLGHARLRITGGDRGLQPFFDSARKLILVFNGEIYNFKALIGQHTEWGSDTDGEVLFRAVAENHTGDLVDAVRAAVPALDGVYAFSAMDQDSVVLARDRVGVKQVYFGEDERLVAFASERKALWRIGLRSQRLNPGEILLIRRSGVTRMPQSFFPILPACAGRRRQGDAHGSRRRRAFRGVRVVPAHSCRAGTGRAPVCNVGRPLKPVP